MDETTTMIPYGQLNFLLSLSFLCLFGHTSYAQTSDLEAKYEIIRQRFLKEFIFIDWGGDAIGTYDEERQCYSQAGYSLPCSGIIPIDNAYKYWEFYDDTCEENKHIDSSARVYKWADATLHLGYYWCVLATEYAWYKKIGEEEKALRTTHELWLALQTYRRLDLTGQQIARHWNETEEQNCEEQLYFTGYSGFFVRDDVPRTFKDEIHVGGIVSSLACRSEPKDFFRDVGRGNVVSHDQSAMLLLGTAFIHKAYTDEDIIINGQEVNIKAIARKIAFGIVSYVHSNSRRWVKFPPCLGKKVQTGGNSFVYAFPMRRILDRQTPNHRIKTRLWDRISWEFFAEDFAAVLTNAIGISSNDNTVMYLTYCASADMESMGDVVRLCEKVPHKEVFPFAKAYINDYDLDQIPQTLKERLVQLLEDCPIEGTGLDAEGRSKDWQFDNRWRASSRRGPPSGRANGLDFLWAYNLYRLLMTEE